MPQTSLPGMEAENQYEVSMCVRDDSSNLCKRHGSSFIGDHQCGAYTLMNGSVNSSDPSTDSYSMATDTIPNNNAFDRSLSVPNLPIPLPTSRRTSELSVNVRPYYSTVVPRARSNPGGETYEFASEVQQHRLSRVSPQLSIPPSIPELPPQMNESDRQSTRSRFYSSIKHGFNSKKEKKMTAFFVMVVISFLAGFIAILLAAVLFGKVHGIEDNFSFLKELIGAPTSSGQTTTGCNKGENVCHPLGGVCVGTNFGYGCFCKEGWTGDGINCTEVTYAKCTDLRNVIGFTSGYYKISPNPGNVEPFIVRCDMQRTKGVTEIGHDSEETIYVSGCDPAGCYSKNITYEANLQQIEAVIESSKYCSQYIKYECYHSSLKYGWWVSRLGTKETRWDDGVEEYSCACSKTNNTCPGCYCNINDSKHREDEGTITNRTLLPIMQLRFGDVGEAWEAAHFTLGKLKCYD
ncbi:uncharacterized protein LOC120330099 [Styela clava]